MDKLAELIEVAVKSIALGALVIILGWAYCKATPNQMSGEYDRAYAAGQAQGLIK